MARYHLLHETVYRYDFPVSLSHHAARLEPLAGARQTCAGHRLLIDPPPADLSRRIDYFGNATHQFSVHRQHRELVVTSEAEVEVLPAAAAPLPSPTCGEVRSLFAVGAEGLNKREIQFTYPSPQVPARPEIERWARPLFADERPFLQAAAELSHRIFEEFTFDPQATEVSTPLEEVFRRRRGVCQDFAHLAVAGVRSAGLPAAYVSGYLLTHPPPGQPRLQGADASHAWFSIHLPALGWFDLDPTNDLHCSDQHITVARGREFADVSPLKGAVTGGGGHEIDIAVTVTPTDAATAPLPGA